MRLLSEDNTSVELPTGVIGSVEGRAGTAGTPNANRRVYPVPVYQKAVESYEAARSRGEDLFGELDHPGPMQPPALRRVALRITGLTLTEDRHLEMQAQVLDTPAGRILHAILESGARVDVSTRGSGSLRPCCPAHTGPAGSLTTAAADHEPHYLVGLDYELHGIDAVVSGAHPGAAIRGGRRR